MTGRPCCSSRHEEHNRDNEAQLRNFQYEKEQEVCISPVIALLFFFCPKTRWTWGSFVPQWCSVQRALLSVSIQIAWTATRNVYCCVQLCRLQAERDDLREREQMQRTLVEQAKPYK